MNFYFNHFNPFSPRGSLATRYVGTPPDPPFQDYFLSDPMIRVKDAADVAWSVGSVGQLICCAFYRDRGWQLFKFFLWNCLIQQRLTKIEMRLWCNCVCNNLDSQLAAVALEEILVICPSFSVHCWHHTFCSFQIPHKILYQASACFFLFYSVLLSEVAEVSAVSSCSISPLHFALIWFIIVSSSLKFKSLDYLKS